MRCTFHMSLLSVPLLAFGISLTGCASSPNDAGAAAGTPSAARVSEAAHDSSQPIDASAAVLKVKGMSCPKCANNITLKLKEVRGVDEVLINMGIGEVIVSFEETVHPTRDELAGAISGAGFTLESITTR